jgi:hypothetical protein
MGAPAALSLNQPAARILNFKRKQHFDSFYAFGRERVLPALYLKTVS